MNVLHAAQEAAAQEAAAQTATAQTATTCRAVTENLTEEHFVYLKEQRAQRRDLGEIRRRHDEMVYEQGHDFGACEREIDSWLVGESLWSMTNVESQEDERKKKKK